MFMWQGFLTAVLKVLEVEPGFIESRRTLAQGFGKELIIT